MTYKVIWEIDIEAESAIEAAAKAREIQLTPHNIATEFKVNGESIDLLDGVEDYNPTLRPNFKITQSDAAFNTFHVFAETREIAKLDNKYDTAINGALDILHRLARMTTPEEDFFADKGYKPGDVPPVHLQPSGFLKEQQSAEDDVSEFIDDMDDERLCSEYATLVELIRMARAALA